MRKLLVVVISISSTVLFGCGTDKKAIRVECVHLINAKEDTSYGRADKITWDNGEITYKKRNCGIDWEREFVTKDPEPVGVVIWND